MVQSSKQLPPSLPHDPESLTVCSRSPSMENSSTLPKPHRAAGWSLPRGRRALVWLVVLAVASPAIIVLCNLLYAVGSIPYCAIVIPHSKQNFMPGKSWDATRNVNQVADGNSSAWPVPKIIHQTWKDLNVPKRWQQAYQSCKSLHRDYKHMFWTDESARQFLAEHYPDALANYDSYPYNIQRVDAIRYYLLYHYGGIYFDLDVGCEQRLDPLRQYPLLLPTTDPVGFSNDVMVAAPKQPLMKAVIESLAKFNRNYGTR